MEANTGMTEDDIDYEPVDFQSDSNDEFQCSKKKVFQFSDIEYTLCLIKPSAMKYKRDICQRIKEEKFTIIRCCEFKFTPETASEFYSEHYGKTWFPKVVLKMCLGPVFAMCIAKDGAIEKLRTLVGPPRVSEARRKCPLSLRALYGLRGDMATNGLHASSSMEKARSEIYFFFKGNLEIKYKSWGNTVRERRLELGYIGKRGIISVFKNRGVWDYGGFFTILSIWVDTFTRLMIKYLNKTIYIIHFISK